MSRNAGWTIIQTMMALLAIGIAVTLVVDYLIDRRCAAEPTLELCTGR